MLTGFIILYKIKDVRKQLLFSVLLSAVLLYTRPEFFLTLVLTSVIYIVYILKNIKGDKDILIKELFPVILISALIFFFNPVFRHRANEAFTQHYAMDIKERDRDTLHSPELVKPEEIMRKDFYTDNSMIEAFINNPKLFFEHIWFNVLRLNQHIGDMFPFFIFNDEQKTLRTFLYVISLILILLTFYFLIERARKKKFGMLGIIYFLYMLPPVISVLIFYPRVHYMILIFAFILIYLSYEISVKINSYEMIRKYSFPAAVLTGILFVIVIPFRGGAKSIHESNCTALKTVFTINNLKLKNEINFLSAGPVISTYIEKDWNFVSVESLESPVQNFIEKNNINLVLVDGIFLSTPVIRKDSTMNKVLNVSGFVKLKIPNCNSYLLAKKNIIELE